MIYVSWQSSSGLLSDIREQRFDFGSSGSNYSPLCALKYVFILLHTLIPTLRLWYSISMSDILGVFELKHCHTIPKLVIIVLHRALMYSSFRYKTLIIITESSWPIWLLWISVWFFDSRITNSECKVKGWHKLHQTVILIY